MKALQVGKSVFPLPFLPPEFRDAQKTLTRLRPDLVLLGAALQNREEWWEGLEEMGVLLAGVNPSFSALLSDPNQKASLLSPFESNPKGPSRDLIAVVSGQSSAFIRLFQDGCLGEPPSEVLSLFASFLLLLQQQKIRHRGCLCLTMEGTFLKDIHGEPLGTAWQAASTDWPFLLRTIYDAARDSL